MTPGDSGSVPAPPMRRQADLVPGDGIARVTAPEDS